MWSISAIDYCWWSPQTADVICWLNFLCWPMFNGRCYLIHGMDHSYVYMCVFMLQIWSGCHTSIPVGRQFVYWYVLKKYPWDGLIVFGLVFFVAGRPSVIRMYFVFDTAMQLARFLMDCLVLASFYYSSDSVDTIYRWSWPRYWHTVLFLHSYLILVQRRLKW